MSSVSIPRPRRISDDQFIGDLMNLFDRRKVKCGDAQALERFAADLSSNNALRSDLFTLCTAISHMAAEDLSGEQLLLLVARALSGAAVPKGTAVADLPESMRTAFLGGYAAWSNRVSVMDEPLSRPPTRPAAPNGEVPSAKESGEAAAEAGPPKGPGDGRRTIQEALEIARERSPNGLVAPRAAGSGANIEHLAISELKKLLEEIEQRLGGLGPQASPQVSGDDVLRNDVLQNDVVQNGVVQNGVVQNGVVQNGVVQNGMVQNAGAREPEPARASEADGRTAQPAMPQADGARAPRAAILPFGAVIRSESQDGKLDEAFLARHSYLRPMVRVTRAGAVAQVSASPIAGPPAAGQASPNASASVAAATPVAVPPRAVPMTVPVPAAGVAAASRPSMAASVALPAAPAVASPAPPMAAPHPAAGAAPRASATFVEPAWFERAPFEEEDARVGLGISLRALGMFAGFVALFCMTAGVLVYRSLHPKTIDDYPELKALIPSNAGSGQGPGTARDAGSDAQVLVTVPDDSLTTLKPEGARSGTSGTMRPKSHPLSQSGPPVSQPGPQASVWPGSGMKAPIDADARASSASPARRGGGAAATPRSATDLLQVPPSTMIGYALSTPKPVYPVDQLQGMSGTVVVAVAISRQGGVTEAWAVSGPDQLRSAAVQAAQAWRFKPYLVDGSPVDVRTTLGFFFKGQ